MIYQKRSLSRSKSFIFVIFFALVSSLCVSVLTKAEAVNLACQEGTDFASVTSGEYTYKTFSNTSAECSFTLPAGVTSVDYLSVGGGGGGGGGGLRFSSCAIGGNDKPGGGGGGGAGGDSVSGNLTVTSGTTLDIQVGSGGSSGSGGGCGGQIGFTTNGIGGTGTSGSESSIFNGVTPVAQALGGTGGTGGTALGAGGEGGSNTNYVGGLNPLLASDCGLTATYGCFVAAGGAGSSINAQDLSATLATSATGGSGGAGYQWSFNSTIYGGGGGGGNRHPFTPPAVSRSGGSGGSGGGGAGNSTGAGVSGTNGLGGGGGGGRGNGSSAANNSNAGAGGNGGNGTVILRFLANPDTSSITVARESFAAGVATNVEVSLAGFNESNNYQVTIKFVDTETNLDVTNGTLSAAQNGTELISGYSSYSAAKLGFKGAYADIVAALSSLTWTPLTSSGDISIRIGVATAPGTDEFYDANSGHYYKYVSTAASWTGARTAAENTYLFGLRGYLAEVNSEAENNFIGNETSAPSIWIGAAEDATTAANFSGSSYSGGAGQRWIWDGAVELPIPTRLPSNGDIAQGPSAPFSSWASGEPNNDAKPGRDCAVTNWAGSKGRWNDLPCTNNQAYLIEFGGRSGDSSEAQARTITKTVKAIEVVTVGTLNANVTCTFEVDCTTPITFTDPTAMDSSENIVAGNFEYSSSNTNSTTVSVAAGGAIIAIIAPGTSTITATFTPSDLTTYAVGTNTFTITVAPKPQATLSITSLLGSRFGLTLSTNGGSGTIDLSYVVNDGTADGCAINTPAASAILTADSAGTCLVTVTNPANGNYAEVSSTETAIELIDLPPAFTLSNTTETVFPGFAIKGYSVTSTGGPILSFSISPQPQYGLIFNSESGEISGTPNRTFKTEYTITAIDILNRTASATYLLTVTRNINGIFGDVPTPTPSATPTPTPTPTPTISKKIKTDSLDYLKAKNMQSRDVDIFVFENSVEPVKLPKEIFPIYVNEKNKKTIEVKLGKPIYLVSPATTNVSYIIKFPDGKSATFVDAESSGNTPIVLQGARFTKTGIFKITVKTANKKYVLTVNVKA